MKLLKTFEGLKPGDILTVRPDAKNYPRVNYGIVRKMLQYKTITIPQDFEDYKITIHGYAWSPEMFVENRNKYIWI